MMRKFLCVLTIIAACLPASGFAQGTAYTFTTVPGLSTNDALASARVMTADSARNLYVYDSGRFVIEKITTTGRISIIAGKPTVQGRDDGTASVATLRGGAG